MSANRLKHGGLGLIDMHDSDAHGLEQAEPATPRLADEIHLRSQPGRSKTISDVSLNGAVSKRMLPGQFESMNPKSMWTRMPCLSRRIYAMTHAPRRHVPVVAVLDLQHIAHDGKGR